MAVSTWQASLLADGAHPIPDADFAGVVRHELSHGAWLEHAPGWLAGADALFDPLVAHLPWRQGVERIHGDEVARPRLTAGLALGWFTAPLEIVPELGALLAARYRVAFTRVGVNLYRDGRDSVAWHGDRIARDLPTACIAIVSIGEPRTFRARPHGGGRSVGFRLGHGDLLVMGGSFQRTWQHAVPKVARAGPRISVTYRHDYPDPTAAWRAGAAQP